MGDLVDARTDIYGLGVTMYRTLTGRLPFVASDDPTLVAHHLFVKPPRPSSIRPGLDTRVEAVLLGATRKRPENRYPTMEALAEDLERLAGGAEGDVAGATLVATPDEYQPVGKTGREAAAALRQLVRT
jgi:serine/threonine-protein kinase